ncbi:MAG: type II CAAX endopeptidase family protein [Halodesulfurarchaeum sp.]|nr:type II CAAX endopeptidase family protein [Halodesulfurarchaeum sp.]
MNGTAERFAPSLGFVLAGLGVATGFLRWTDPVAVGPVESVPGLVFGLLAFAGFAARRYGATDRRLSVLAGAGSGGLVAAASVAVLHPSAMTGTGVGLGLPIAFVVGLLGVGVAVADYLDQDRRAVLLRGRYAADALFIGLTGLLVGFLFSMASFFAFADSGTIASSGLGTVAFSLGLGVVAVGYLVLTDRGWSFIDIALPTKRGWLYVIGGTITMFVLLGGLGALTEVLGIPSAEHGLVEQAREAPLLLLAFVPLSWFVIGPGEELLSRNIVQKHLYDGFSRPAAVLVGTLVFTAIHLPAYATGPPPAIFATLIQLFVISLVLGIVYERTENVVVPALVHGTYNAVQFGLAYLAITAGVL